jgi:hypothetical protein
MDHLFSYFLELRLLRENKAVREEVLRHILSPNSDGEMASFRDVYEFIWYVRFHISCFVILHASQFYVRNNIFQQGFLIVISSSFGHGTTVRDLCIRYNPKERLGIDVCKMIR